MNLNIIRNDNIDLNILETTNSTLIWVVLCYLHATSSRPSPRDVRGAVNSNESDASGPSESENYRLDTNNGCFRLYLHVIPSHPAPRVARSFLSPVLFSGL